MRHNLIKTICVSLFLWAVLFKAQLLANTHFFYQQHLRNSRVASESRESDADLAMGKLAARLSGKKQPCRHTLPINEIRANPENIATLLKLNPGPETLATANKLKNMLTGPHLPLEEYIARCYWATGQNFAASKLSTTLLKQIESPTLRRLLFTDAMHSGNYSLARHHLAKTGLRGEAYLRALAQIVLAEAGFPMIILAVLFAVLILILCWLNMKRFFRYGQSRFSPFPASTPTTVLMECSQSGDDKEAQQALPKVSPAISENMPKTDLPDAPYPNNEQEDSMLEEVASHSKKMKENQAPHFNNELGFANEDSARLFFLSLQLAVSEKMLRIIGITSTTRNTNKAIAAMQLARRFGEDDYKTLLIDANDHGPLLNEIDGCDKSPGLSELADPETHFSTICHSTNLNQLSLIACGNKRSGFTDLPEQTWVRLLSYCRSNFEIVVIILPSVENLTDRFTLLQQFGLILIEEDTNDNDELAAIELLKSAEKLAILGQVKLSSQK